MSKVETITKTIYYITNISNSKFYSVVNILGDRTVMDTREKQETVYYDTLREAADIRTEIGIDTLNIVREQIKVRKPKKADEVKSQAETVRLQMLNAM